MVHRGQCKKAFCGGNHRSAPISATALMQSLAERFCQAWRVPFWMTQSHTSKDKLSEIRMDDDYQTYRLMAAYLAHLDPMSEAPGSK